MRSKSIYKLFNKLVFSTALIMFGAFFVRPICKTLQWQEQPIAGSYTDDQMSRELADVRVDIVKRLVPNIMKNYSSAAPRTTARLKTLSTTVAPAGAAAAAAVPAPVVTKIQQKRLHQVSAACARLRVTDPNVTKVDPDWKEMYVDENRRYMYCLVSKVSCTSWKRTLLWMTGKSPKHIKSPANMTIGFIHNYKWNDIVMRRMVNFTQKERNDLINGTSYYKFMFVREPMDRLVSAYRDKVLSDPVYFINEIIIEKIRKNGTKSHKVNANMAQNRTSNLTAVPVEPKATFAEFVTYILDQRARKRPLDRHWRPQTELCSPCTVGYDFIGHQDTLHADAEIVLDVIRQRRALSPIPIDQKYQEVKFPDSDSPHGYSVVDLAERRLQRKEKSRKIVVRMLSELSDVALKQIIDLYTADYKVFGYQMPLYLLKHPSNKTAT